jgi:TalC/MipB family fructose-6-phosphate aldolase
VIDLFLDSADPTALKEHLPTQVFAGVTTNPTLVERSGLDTGRFADLLGLAREHGVDTVFFQAWGRDTAELLRNAAWLRDLGPEVGVKVPVTPAGLACARRLVDDGVTVLVTAVYHPKQLLLAASLGVAWVAPYVGRMSDAGRDGVAATLRMQRVLDASGSRTRLLVASLRTVDDVLSLAEGGVRGFTVSPALAAQLATDPHTDAAVEEFEAAARRADAR